MWNGKQCWGLQTDTAKIVRWPSPAFWIPSYRNCEVAVIDYQNRKTFLEMWLYWKKVPVVRTNGSPWGMVNVIKHTKQNIFVKTQHSLSELWRTMIFQSKQSKMKYHFKEKNHLVVWKHYTKMYVLCDNRSEKYTEPKVLPSYWVIKGGQMTDCGLRVKENW